MLTVHDGCRFDSYSGERIIFISSFAAELPMAEASRGEGAQSMTVKSTLVMGSIPTREDEIFKKY